MQFFQFVLKKYLVGGGFPREKYVLNFVVVMGYEFRGAAFCAYEIGYFCNKIE